MELNRTPSQSTQQWRGPRRFLFLILAVFAAASVWLIASRWTGAEDLTTKSTAVITPVDAVAVEAVDSITTERYFTGRVAARRSSQLAFERAARVVAVLVDEGDRVRKGQPLARLDNRDLELRKAQLQANLARAQARLDELVAGPRKEAIAAAKSRVQELQEQLEFSQLQTKRRQELLGRQAISREEFDQLAFRSRGQQAALDSAQAQLNELLTGTREEQVRAQRGVVDELSSQIGSVQLDQDKSTLRAPYAGRIQQKMLDEGAFATPGQTAMTLVEEAKPEVRIGLPAEAARTIAVGDQRTIEIGGQDYSALAKGLLPELEAATRTATLVFELETQQPDAVFSGQIARLALSQQVDAAGFWLPLESLTRGVRGLWACYVVVESDDGQTLEQRQVEILSTEGDRALVRGAIESGDRVVRSGVNRVAAGQRIRTGS